MIIPKHHVANMGKRGAEAIPGLLADHYKIQELIAGRA